jgi:carboxylesterase type B
MCLKGTITSKSAIMRCSQNISNMLLCRIRFAAPPTGVLRWQAPQPPIPNRGSIIDASTFGAACPHSLRSGQYNRTLPGPISEDCLFVNVWAPKLQSKSGLPVFVNIHGGGYGAGDGREDLSGLVNANDNGFVGVSIQYRVSKNFVSQRGRT